LLWLPGYLTIRLVFPEWRGQLERAALSFGLSLSYLIFCGLLLNRFNALTTRGWAIATAGLLFVLLYLCAHRRRVSDAGEESWLRVSPRQIVALSAAAIAGIWAIGISADGAIARRPFLFTEFWMVPSPDHVLSSVVIGVKNEERQTSVYGVDVLAEGTLIYHQSGIKLFSGEEWVRHLPVPVRATQNQRIEAWLFNKSNPHEIYRKVWLAIPPGRPTPTMAEAR
jgi:uncharacterized membrane protein